MLKYAWQLAAVGYKDNSENYRKKQQYKIVFNVLVSPYFSKNWFKMLQSDIFKEIFKVRPQLYIKPYRPYICTSWSKQKRIEILQNSYKILQTKPQLYKKLIIDNQDIILSKFILADGREYIVKFGYNFRFRKEGEFVLLFETTDDLSEKQIVALAFSFDFTETEDIKILIGCIQGRQNNKELKSLQKLMFGLRPKSFILYTLQWFGELFDIKKIYGITDKRQAHRQKHFINIPWIHSISFNYDKFWEESEGVKVDENWYQLPLQVQLKDINEIKSKKRSMYRKRYALLDEIKNAINEYN